MTGINYLNDSTVDIEYHYNDQGVRVSKETSTHEYEYIVDGTLINMNYQVIEYYYISNTQGDIIGIIHGAVFGALSGLVVDFAVATAGIGGAALISGVGNFMVGAAASFTSQLFIENKQVSEVDLGAIFITAALSGFTSALSGAFGGMLNSTQGWNSSGTVMQKMIQSMSHVENWVASGIISMPLIGLNIIGSYYDKV